MGAKQVLSRYERADDGRVIIDVSASRVEDLYNTFDRRAPYVKKDLDQDLVEYLSECARDIGSRPFLIRVNLPELPEPDLQERVRVSVRHFFDYLQALEQRKFRKLLRTSSLLAALGVGLIILSLAIGRNVTEASPLPWRLASEGITIAAWVSLWEALAMLMFSGPSSISEGRMFRRLSRTSVEFQQVDSQPLLSGTATR